jgi:hypothetical protein
MRRIGLSLVLLLCLAAGLATAGSAGREATPRFVFPVVGQVQYTNDFGAPRSIGPHQGNDIMAPRRALAVATEAGKVMFWTHSDTAGCMLYLYGTSGTTYLYIHLNNDLTDHNDNRGKCVAGTSYAPGLKDGAKVQAGQLLGFVGDSGDANGIATHLHFEVHPHDGNAVNPYPYLNRAYRPLFAVRSAGTFTLSAAATVVSTELNEDGTSATLIVEVKSLRVWPGAYRIPSMNRRVALTVSDTDSIQHLGTGPAPAATTVSLARLTSAKKGQAVTVTTAPAPVKLDALLGRGLFDAATVVLKST